MWIRTQDKTQLIECRSFTIKQIQATINEIMPKSKQKELEKHANEYVIKADMINTLGYYSTNEKALKVLDVIQENINLGGTLFCIDNHKTDMGYTSVYQKVLGVFQMPQDDEVLE